MRDLVIHGDDLVIATHGRSFWILDDVTPLRQMTAEVAQSAAWLFEPETAYRVRPGTDQGTPVPLDEPQAANPPDGAVLDYYLKEAPSTPLQLEIFDLAGNLVRRFASDDVLKKTNPDEMELTNPSTILSFVSKPGCTIPGICTTRSPPMCTLPFMDRPRLTHCRAGTR